MAIENEQTAFGTRLRRSRRAFLRASLMLVGAGAGASLALAFSDSTAASSPGQAEGPAQSRALTQAVASTGPASTAASVATKQSVSLRYNWTVKGEFTPFVVAQEKGFYQEQGLEVELGEGRSGTQAVQVVGSGNDHFGYVPSIQVVQGINQGIPVRSVATCGRNTGMCWASWPEVSLDGPKALEGRKVSISTASTFFQVWEAFARKFGVDTSQVDVVQADPSARVGLFLSRQVEVMADIFVANDYVILQTRTREPLNQLKLADLDFDPLGYLLIVNGSVLERDRELVRSFVHASLKGFQFVLDSPDEAIAIMTGLYGDRLGAEVLEGQVKNLLPLIQREPTLGKTDAASWDRSLEILHDSGVIDRRLAHSEYYTDELVEA
jgi:NitT/TauT family transport system substrate-binding protein